MSIVCTFHLSKISENYESGEDVKGFINLYLSDPQEIEDIHIALRGHGLVQWKEKGNKRNNSNVESERIEYSSHENYVQYRNLLMRNGNLDEGEHIFPFSLPLPAECPGSFASSLGIVRFYLVVILVTKSAKREKFRYDVWVEKKEDLNLKPQYKLPVQVEQIKTFCWLACTNGPILITLSTPFGAFVPLQKMQYTLRMENQSMYDVVGYQLAIMQIISYTARKPVVKKRFETNEVLYKKFNSKCLRLTTRLFERYIQIPAVPPSTGDENDQSIISIQYELKVKVLISDYAEPSYLSMPLHLGSIALLESLQAALDDDTVNIPPGTPMLPPTSSTPELPSTSRNIASPPSYGNFHPPSFTDAIRNNPPQYDSIAD